MKPILFNTAMVQAILEGRKTTTRIINKDVYDVQYIDIDIYRGLWVYGTKMKCTSLRMEQYIKEYSKYQVGDILYVRETWCIHSMKNYEKNIKFLYKARPQELNEVSVSNERYRYLIKFISNNRWQPSLFMPKEAARIFLRVKDVRVERLQDITDEGSKAEGSNVGIGFSEKMRETATDRFIKIWNSTVNKKDLDKYGWDSNPYVWVIEFEKISKDEIIK